MKRIVTVQDLINELMLVVNKEAEINVTVAGDDYETEYTPYLYDFSIIDFTDVHPDDGEAEDRVVLRVQEAKEEGIRQGIWLCIQKLVELERFDMAKYFMISFGFNKNECEGLLDKNGLNDKMDVFINRLFNENNHIRYLKDIGYHKIGSIFKYNTGMEKIELEVIEIDDSSCDGCVFNNRGYYCMYSCCCNIDREDNTDVIYKEVKRS